MMTSISPNPSSGPDAKAVSALTAAAFPVTFEVYFDNIERQARAAFERKEKRPAAALPSADAYLRTAGKVLTRARELQAQRGDLEQLYVLLYRYALLIGSWLPRNHAEWARLESPEKNAARMTCGQVLDELERLKPQLRHYYEDRKQRLLSAALGSALYAPSPDDAQALVPIDSSSSSSSAAVFELSRDFKHLSLLMSLDPQHACSTSLACQHHSHRQQQNSNHLSSRADSHLSQQQQQHGGDEESAEQMAPLYPTTRAIRTGAFQYTPQRLLPAPDTAPLAPDTAPTLPDSAPLIQEGTTSSLLPPPPTFSSAVNEPSSVASSLPPAAPPAVSSLLSLPTFSSPASAAADVASASSSALASSVFHPHSSSSAAAVASSSLPFPSPPTAEPSSSSTTATTVSLSSQSSSSSSSSSSRIVLILFLLFSCAGLEYLHSMGVLYRDLKPENLLLRDDGHICMTDFGISKQGLGDNDRTSTFCGTPEYLAPEVLQGSPYGKGVDWWAFGTLMYEMLTGLPPFYSKDVQQMYQKILTQPLNIPSTVSPEARSLLTQLLEKDPNKRLADAKLIKQHPWFKPIDWKLLLEKEVTPPYIPPVKSKEDMGMIAEEFKRQTVSGLKDTAPISDKDNAAFGDFTFVSPAVLNK